MFTIRNERRLEDAGCGLFRLDFALPEGAGFSGVANPDPTRPAGRGRAPAIAQLPFSGRLSAELCSLDFLSLRLVSPRGPLFSDRGDAEGGAEKVRRIGRKVECSGEALLFSSGRISRSGRCRCRTRAGHGQRLLSAFLASGWLPDLPNFASTSLMTSRCGST